MLKLDLELGSGMQMNPDSVEKGVRGENYLIQKKGLIPELAGADTGSHEMTFTLKVRWQSTMPQLVAWFNRVPLGNSVKAGERLYQIISFNKAGDLPT